MKLGLTEHLDVKIFCFEDNKPVVQFAIFPVFLGKRMITSTPVVSKTVTVFQMGCSVLFKLRLALLEEDEICYMLVKTTKLEEN